MVISAATIPLYSMDLISFIEWRDPRTAWILASEAASLTPTEHRNGFR